MSSVPQSIRLPNDWFSPFHWTTQYSNPPASKSEMKRQSWRSKTVVHFIAHLQKNVYNYLVWQLIAGVCVSDRSVNNCVDINFSLMAAGGKFDRQKSKKKKMRRQWIVEEIKVRNNDYNVNKEIYLHGKKRSDAINIEL